MIPTVKNVEIIGDGKFTARVNSQNYIGSFSVLPGTTFVNVTYMRNTNREKQTTTRIKVEAGFALETII